MSVYRSGYTSFMVALWSLAIVAPKLGTEFIFTAASIVAVVTMLIKSKGH